MRREVAKILQTQGLAVVDEGGGSAAGDGADNGRSARPSGGGGGRRPQKKIDIQDPPTYICIMWAKDSVPFYAEQRRYLRIETDAPGHYHDAKDPAKSRINIIVDGEHVTSRGSTALKNGRMRAIFECAKDATNDASGSIVVELSVPGKPTLSATKSYSIVPRPPAKPSSRAASMPRFRVEAVSPDDGTWASLNWPEPGKIAAETTRDDEGIIVYYNSSFPKFEAQRSKFESRSPALAASYVKRYEIWTVVHALLLDRDQRDDNVAIDDELDEIRERQERCRFAVVASMVAAHDVQNQGRTEDDDDQ
jgi:hypothetical protein